MESSSSSRTSDGHLSSNADSECSEHEPAAPPEEPPAAPPEEQAEAPIPPSSATVEDEAKRVQADQLVASLAQQLLDAEAAPSQEATADAISSVFARVQDLADENLAMRRAADESRAEEARLLEANRELEWQVKTGGGAAADTFGMKRVLAEAEAKVELLMTENGVLEARAREAAAEVAGSRQICAQLQASQAQAVTEARRAIEASEYAENEARKERLNAKEAGEAALEAQAVADAGDASLVKIRRELEVTREEATGAFKQVASLRAEVEKMRIMASTTAAEHARNRSDAKLVRDELELRLHETGSRLQRSEHAAEQARKAAETHLAAGERMTMLVAKAEDEAAAAHAAAKEAHRVASAAVGRETELEQQVAALSKKLELQSELLARSATASQREGEVSAVAHARALDAAKEAAREAAALATEREAALLAQHEGYRASLEREAREKAHLQSALDTSLAATALAKSERAEAAAGGELAAREMAAQTRARMEEAEYEATRLRGELKTARDECARVRAGAERAASEVERAEVRCTRAVGQAAAERDAMAARLAQRGEAADATVAEAQRAEARRQIEMETVRKNADAEVAAASARCDAIRKQLDDAVGAASGLQELLTAQQRVAEAYRDEAQRTLAKLGELEAEAAAREPAALEQALEAHRASEESARQALAAQLQAQIGSSLQRQASVGSIENVRSGLSELRDGLSELRLEQQQQLSAVANAKAVVA